MNKLLGALSATAVCAAALMVSAQPSSASVGTANCVYSRSGLSACFYWGSNETGSFTQFSSPVPNFGVPGQSFYATFLSAGSGQGGPVKNNSASVHNNSGAGTTVVVYYNENYTGVHDSIPAQSSKNLVNTKNENASFTIS